MTTMTTWKEALDYVLTSGSVYIHEQLTLEKRDGKRSIAILTPGKTWRGTPQEAIDILNQYEF